MLHLLQIHLQFHLESGAAVIFPPRSLEFMREGSAGPAALQVDRAVGVVDSTLWGGILMDGPQDILAHLLDNAAGLGGRQEGGGEWR